jgi:hypothetical protein
MSDLSRASQETRRANRARVLAALDMPQGGRMSSADLAARTCLSPATNARILRDLQNDRLVGRDSVKGPVFLTAAGRAELHPVDVASDAGGEFPAALRAVLGVQPCEEFRAFLRLHTATVIARQHLGDQVDTGWPAFVAAGGAGSGKSGVLYRSTCVIFGSTFAEGRHMLRNRTRADIMWRKVQLQGGKWATVPSRILDSPMVCFDEVHEAEGEARAALRDLMEGSAKIQGVDGQMLSVRPVVLATGNVGAGFETPLTGRGGLVPPNLLRRSVVLDTRPLEGYLLPLVPSAAAALVEMARTVCPVPLARMKPAAATLPEDCRSFIASFRTGTSPFTTEGAATFSPDGLALTALGYSALLPSDWPEQRRLSIATLAVSKDYLCVRATVDGQVRPGEEWSFSEVFDRLRDACADLPELLPTFERTPVILRAADDATDAEIRTLEGDFHRRQSVAKGKITDVLADLPTSPISWWSSEQRDQLREHRADLTGHGKALSAVRPVHSTTGMRDALRRLDTAERDASVARDRAVSWHRDMSLIPEPSRPPAGRRGRSNTPPPPVAASRTRRPKKGEPAIAGGNWVEKL